MTIEIFNVDCMEYMTVQPDNAFDLAIVDPPYGIGIVQQFEKNISTKGMLSGQLLSMSKGIVGGRWDDNQPGKEYFYELTRVSNNQIIWGGNYFIDHLSSTKCFIIWDKMNGANTMADAEMAWTSFKKRSRIFRMHHFSHGYGEKIHPTQKPIKLYQWILTNYAQPCQRILDTHLGSGSSAIAAHYFGCNFVGCEMDPGHYAAAKARVTAETSQVDMFSSVG